MAPVAFRDVPTTPIAAATAAAVRPMRTWPVGVAELVAAVSGVSAATTAGVRLAGAGAAGVAVTGVTLRARDVRPGDLFAALPGARAHGADFAGEALAAGAAALLTDPCGA